jgi:hypothetical protein
MTIETTVHIGYKWELFIGWYNPMPNGGPNWQSPINKTNWSARMELRPEGADPASEPIVTLVLGDGITFDAEHVIPKLTVTQTALLEPDVIYVAAVRMIPPSGENDAELLVELKMLADRVGV